MGGGFPRAISPPDRFSPSAWRPRPFLTARPTTARPTDGRQVRFPFPTIKKDPVRAQTRIFAHVVLTAYARQGMTPPRAVLRMWFSILHHIVKDTLGDSFANGLGAGQPFSRDFSQKTRTRALVIFSKRPLRMRISPI